MHVLVCCLLLLLSSPAAVPQAYTNAKKGDQVASGQCLFQLANLLTVLPIIEPGSAQVSSTNVDMAVCDVSACAPCQARI